MAKHYFEAVQVESSGNFAVLDTFNVTKRRTAAEAYDMAETLCEQARNMPHRPAAFVRERNGEVMQTHERKAGA